MARIRGIQGRLSDAAGGKAPGIRFPLVFLAVGVMMFFAAACQRWPATNEWQDAPEIIVAAASDLAPAFAELGKLFEEENRVKVTFSFGSTGNLANQIENGAPVDLFAAANVGFIEELEKKGLILPGTKALYARGRITVWTRGDSPLQMSRLEDLTRPEARKVAIANPEHAPYGMAAREALQSAGVWDAVQPKLVLGENVRQTLQYAETGNVDVAIVALSLSVQSKGRWALIPDHLHKPLDQALAVIKGTRHEQEARRFAAFINGEQGRPVMRKYGFTLPGEEPVSSSGSTLKRELRTRFCTSILAGRLYTGNLALSYKSPGPSSYEKFWRHFEEFGEFFCVGFANLSLAAQNIRSKPFGAE